jgi:uncharacterized protein YoxC
MSKSKIDIETLKQDIVDRERQRKQEEAQRATEQSKANLDKQAKAEISKREKNLKSLENRIASIEGRISELTKGGKILSEFRLKQNVDSYNEAIDLQEKLSNEISSIAKGNYKVVDKKFVIDAPSQTSPFSGPQVGEGLTPAGKKTKDTSSQTGIVTPDQPEKSKDQKALGGTGGTGGTRRTGQTGSKDTGTRGGKKDNFEAVMSEAKSLYGGIDEVFRTNKELEALLTKAVGKTNDPSDNYTVDRFISELSNTKWFKSNAGPIRQRGFFKRQYEELENQLKTDDPKYQEKLEELDKTSEYGRGLGSTIASIKEAARSIGRQIDDATVRVIAKNIYDYANEADPVKIRDAILGSGKFTVGGITTGEAGTNKQTLLAVARANGLDLEANFGQATIDTWLDKVAKGESIETIKNLIRQTAKTTWQVDDRVSALLDQGVDLQTVYSPFRKQMAATLELPEDEITIDELYKKGLFGSEKPMNLYDFKRSLRKDDRWQYTENAREEVASFTEELLRDFGFVG